MKIRNYKLKILTAASRQSGQVLFEILLAVAVIIGVAAVSMQLSQMSLQSAEVQGGKWVLVAGSENVTINSEAYARFLVVDNVSRDSSSGDIESTYNTSNDDPSTQKITIT